jgi:CRISPR-associated endonuclease Cas1
MQAQRIEPASDGICVARGYGLKIYVHRGHLIVHDGIGRDRQTRRYHRVTSKLRRLVILGHTGYITLEALRWLKDVAAALIHVDEDGRLITASAASGPGHAALRRSQALATLSDAGLEVARELLSAKVAGQASLLSELPAGPDGVEPMARTLDTIADASTFSELLAAEAEAAVVYWDAWSDLTVPIGSRDPCRVPEHWHTFGTRHSLLTNSPRLACNPANAILNYLYALLEAETVLACHAVGLDPLVGIFHTDQRNRASLALDAMEPVRPIIDADVLALLTQRTLAREDFIETRQGNCRLSSQLAGQLAGTLDSWRHHVAPIVEGITDQLARSLPSAVTTSTPLTRAQHHAAWDDRAPNRNRRQSRVATPTLPNSCRDCGTHLPDRRRHYCEDCRANRWENQTAKGRQNGATVLARLRAEQRDPAHGGRAAQSRGRKNAAHQRAVRDWDGPPPDPAAFQSDILPRLRGLAINDLVAATGLSSHYCSLIRLGKRVPHARHWETLRRLGS